MDNITDDVISDADFKSLMMDNKIVESLLRNGYRKPSPVQAQVIPLAMLGMSECFLDHVVSAFTDTVFKISWLKPKRVQAKRSCFLY